MNFKIRIKAIINKLKIKPVIEIGKIAKCLREIAINAQTITDLIIRLTFCQKAKIVAKIIKKIVHITGEIKPTFQPKL